MWSQDFEKLVEFLISSGHVPPLTSTLRDGLVKITTTTTTFADTAAYNTHVQHLITEKKIKAIKTTSINNNFEQLCCE